MPQNSKITPFLWFEKEAHQVAEYYISIFPDSRIIQANDFMATFELFGQRFSAMNGGQKMEFTNAVSFYVECKDQEEIDRYWDQMIADGGEEMRCGWMKDKFGVVWQIIPEALPDLVGNPNREKAGKATKAMMDMKKIILADLQAAFDS